MKILEGRITELIDFVKMKTGEWKLKHEVINLFNFFSQIALNFKEDASVFKRKFKSSIEIPRNITDRCLFHCLMTAAMMVQEDRILTKNTYDSIQELLHKKQALLESS